jgi:hypothetical protein
MVTRVFAVLFVVLLVVGIMRPLPTQAQDGSPDCAPAQGKVVTISAAYLYLEYNATAGDLGVHGFFDDHGWSELCVYDPAGTLVLAVKPQAQLKDQTISGIFFESREPAFSELSVEDLLARFPEGEYTVIGTNFDGTALTGVATLTHHVPQPPTINAPALAADEESAEVALKAGDPLRVEWQDVTTTTRGDPVTISGYEVIVTLEAYDDPNGFSQPIFDVHVGPDRNALTVSPEFFEPGTVYQIEVLALEVSGNQTISEGYFRTE